MANGDSDRVWVISPQGKLGSVSKDQQDAAVSAGYVPRSDAIKVMSPKTGQAGYIPKSQWNDAKTQGYMLHPEEQAERQGIDMINKAWVKHQQQQMKLGQYQHFAESSPTPVTNASALFGVGALQDAAASGSLREVGATALRGAKGAAKGAAVTGTAGGAFGYALGGPSGAMTGAQIGGTLGAGYGIFEGMQKPPTLDQEADQIVAKQLAVRAARVRAGIDPPSEDTIAEVLRKEFLSPPKKSGVPQEISSPSAKTPTYVPQGVPGAPEVPEPPKTIGQIARERVADVTRKAGMKSLQRTADVEAGVGPKPAAPPQPEMSKLSEGPTALQHQAARQNALEDIRNATVNKPGWVSKLPDRVTFKKLSPDQQRALITQAVQADEQASNAIREGARSGSAGDLASWTADDLWARFMKEFQSPKPNDSLKQSLANELARRGLTKASPQQVRP